HIPPVVLQLLKKHENHPLGCPKVKCANKCLAPTTTSGTTTADGITAGDEEDFSSVLHLNTLSGSGVSVWDEVAGSPWEMPACPGADFGKDHLRGGAGRYITTSAIVTTIITMEKNDFSNSPRRESPLIRGPTSHFLLAQKMSDSTTVKPQLLKQASATSASRRPTDHTNKVVPCKAHSECTIQGTSRCASEWKLHTQLATRKQVGLEDMSLDGLRIHLRRWHGLKQILEIIQFQKYLSSAAFFLSKTNKQPLTRASETSRPRQTSQHR
ncbi:hypothetical protein J0S82_015780, partial [Galemys pyrenaicus]